MLVRDITVRKQLEIELAQIQAEKLAVLESIPDAIFIELLRE
jgi:PAS domain-containing protein